ncbi:MAG TPA: hypothetical protein VFU47_01800 [Armatimonadota bacterium]|nr:hypothetical protein [Armatimonadota bacterium]
MHRLLVPVLFCAAGLALPAGAAERPIPEPLQEGTPVVIVGQISSTPGDVFGTHKMQVVVGETQRDYTLHFRDAVMKGPAGEKWTRGDFDAGQWVRAEGRVMEDPRRVWVDRLRVITPEEASTIRQTAFYRPGYPYGYVAVTGDTEYRYGTHRYATENRYAFENRSAADRERYGYVPAGAGDRYYEQPSTRVAGSRGTYYTTRRYYPASRTRGSYPTYRRPAK